MVLENKLGITNSADLAKEQEKLSRKRAIELFEEGLLSLADAGSFSSLLKIHEYLFQDIYDFAGKIRTVNIAKGSFRFAPVMYLKEALKSIEKMPQQSFQQIV